jgi:hypothetical protein
LTPFSAPLAAPPQAPVKRCFHAPQTSRVANARLHQAASPQFYSHNPIWDDLFTQPDAEIKTCPDCGTQTTRAPFPEAFCGPVEYGAGIKAYVLNLLIGQMISLKPGFHGRHLLVALSNRFHTVLASNQIDATAEIRAHRRRTRTLPRMWRQHSFESLL